MLEVIDSIQTTQYNARQYVSYLKNTTFSHQPLCAYIYDLNELHHHLSTVLSELPKQCKMFYATKANSEMPILKSIAKHCHGFEVASAGELNKIRQQFPSIPIAFGGPGKTDDELKACLDNQVQFIHVESLHELIRLDHFSQEKQQIPNVLLRLNLHFESFKQTCLTMGGKPSAFGMDEQMLFNCLHYLKNNTSIHLKGLHFHLVSFQTDESQHAKLIKQYINYLHHINQRFELSLQHLNVGGGIGVNYLEPSHRFNWLLFFDLLKPTLEKSQNSLLSIYFECGRSLSVYCGYYATEILDIKQSHGEYFAIIRGGTHHFRTPYAQSHSHPFKLIKIKDWQASYPRLTITDKTVNIVGQLCTPKDVLASHQAIDTLSIGDIVLFSHAGAYAWNISHHDFLCHPHPEHYFLGDDL